MINHDAKKEEFLKFMPAREFEYHIHISKINAYIYFEVPKVACSTIKFKLQQLEAKATGVNSISEDMSSIHNKKESLLLSPGNIGFPEFWNMLNDDSIFKFTFVRNPYTRILSAYLNKIQFQNSPHRKKILEISKISDNETLTFKKFLSTLSTSSSYEMDPHWRIQTAQIFHGLINFDFIGRFENLEEDLNQVMNKIISHSPFQEQLEDRGMYLVERKGDRTNSTQKIHEFYDSETRNMVKKIYMDDFVNFKYPKKLLKNI